MRFRTILTLSVTAAALMMKSLTDTFICSEKRNKQDEVMLRNEPVFCNNSTINTLYLLFWTLIRIIISLNDSETCVHSIYELGQAGWVRSATTASFSSRPLMQYQTVMNAVSGIINDLTVKSFCSWTMRLRTNNRRERIPPYTYRLSNRSGMTIPFPPSQRQDPEGFTVCLKARQC